MSDTAQNPPRGDFQKAEKYINQLVDLINRNKIEVTHTDLKKFDPTTLQDHYTVSLSTYHIELSHSKQPNSDKDSYVMIFNNLKHLAEGTGDKVILAYIYMAESQFSKFKMVADRQIHEKQRVEEEKSFSEALKPIDEILDQVSGETTPQLSSEKSQLMESFRGELNDSLESKDEKTKEFSVSQIHQI